MKKGELIRNGKRKNTSRFAVVVSVNDVTTHVRTSRGDVEFWYTSECIPYNPDVANLALEMEGLCLA